MSAAQEIRARKGEVSVVLLLVLLIVRVIICVFLLLLSPGQEEKHRHVGRVCVAGLNRFFACNRLSQDNYRHFKV